MGEEENPIAVVAFDLDEDKCHMVARCIRCGSEIARWVQRLGRPEIENIVRDHQLVCTRWRPEDAPPLIPYSDTLVIRTFPVNDDGPQNISQQVQYDRGFKHGKAEGERREKNRNRDRYDSGVAVGVAAGRIEGRAQASAANEQKLDEYMKKGIEAGLATANRLNSVLKVAQVVEKTQRRVTIHQVDRDFGGEVACWAQCYDCGHRSRDFTAEVWSHTFLNPCERDERNRKAIDTARAGAATWAMEHTCRPR